MKTRIIHKLDRVDRIPFVAEILANFPEAKVAPAIAPLWVGKPDGVAVRGNACSVLKLVRHEMTKDAPLLVLEDDAKVIPAGWEAYESNKGDIPPDAGIIVLGGDVSKYEEQVGYFREVLPPFWGSHAVLYLPRLLETSFLLNAMEIAMTNDLSTKGLCVESLLMMALHPTGLKVYRPEQMAFTTHESHSDTFNKISPPREVALNLNP